ncbi:MAG TPA: hypothetical protein PKW35_24205 [Nannocystaceae bacterium]|nr:hypothetical protein [Nannocystaceae bacterium]
MRAAVALACKYLARVCFVAVDGHGHVLEHIEDVFGDAMTDVYVFDGSHVLDPDADRPVLRGMFVQEISSALSRRLDVFFINAPDAELAFWRDTLGARTVGDFIVASGLAPVYPRPVRARPARQARPRLRVLGRRGDPN